MNQCYDCRWMRYRGWLFWRSMSCSNTLIALYEVPVEKIRDNCPMFEKKEFAQPRQDIKPVPALPPRPSIPPKPTPMHEPPPHQTEKENSNMDSHQVEDFGIDDNGELWVQRKGEVDRSPAECPFTTQYSPPQEGSLVRGGGYFFSRRCGTWCPLLGRVQDDLLPVKSISLCHKSIWCHYKQ